MEQQIWTDGRTGEAGCVAGNHVLRTLEGLEGPIRNVRGTVFETARAVLVGRVCSSDEYLTDPVLHWANASWDQHADLQRLAAERGKEFAYLFVTASNDPPSVRYWRVPGEVVEAAFVARDRNRRGMTCAIHINADGSGHFLGRTDVTEHHAVLALAEPDTRKLADAFKARDRSEPTAGSRSARPVAARRPAVVTQPRKDVAYDIPVSGGRSVTLRIPGPLSGPDVARVKSWLDVTADVLTEGYQDPAAAAERRWLAEQVQEGLDELARGERVDGEQAFDQILRAREARQGIRG